MTDVLKKKNAVRYRLIETQLTDGICSTNLIPTGHTSTKFPSSH